jgi:hypothetical protein
MVGDGALRLVLLNLVSTPPAVLILAALVVPVGFAVEVLFKRRPMRLNSCR